MTISDTSEVPCDTVFIWGELIYFKGNSPWLKRIKYFGESFALVNALIITILISIIHHDNAADNNSHEQEKDGEGRKTAPYLMEKYQSLIVDFLYGSATPEEFRSIASDNYRRQVLIDQMIDVSVNLKGEESNKLIGLYKFSVWTGIH